MRIRNLDELTADARVRAAALRAGVTLSQSSTARPSAACATLEREAASAADTLEQLAAHLELGVRRISDVVPA